MASALFVKGEASGAKAQNEEWLGTDFSPGTRLNKALRLILQISLSVQDAIVEITLDGGGTFSALNSGTALTIGNTFTFDVFVKNGDDFNIRTPTGGGTTVVNFVAVADLDA